jgi:hypothetical protein
VEIGFHRSDVRLVLAGSQARHRDRGEDADHDCCDDDLD